MSLKSQNAARWNRMIVHPNAIPLLDKVAHKLVAAKNRYQNVEDKTGVPWPLIAVIHQREASQSWMANLAQGDRWDRVSRHIPRGQGPFKSWDAAAVNALMHSAPFLGHNKDWSIGQSLAELEKYNGLGYARMGRPSPYIWSKSNQYIRGKYIADGVYSSTTVDVQQGCAPILRRMMHLDPTINQRYKWDERTSPVAAPAVAGLAVVAGGTAAAAHSPELWPWIVGGVVTLFLIVSGIFYVYQKEKK